jgi:uncharacterized protein YbjT (DUF2867 family)
LSRSPRRSSGDSPGRAGPASHAGKTYWLTVPELVSNYDLAAVLSGLLGRPARSFEQFAADHATVFS